MQTCLTAIIRVCTTTSSAEQRQDCMTAPGKPNAIIHLHVHVDVRQHLENQMPSYIYMSYY